MKIPFLASLFISFFLIGCATVGGGSSAVRTPEQRADDLFDIFDANGDGVLTRDELEGGIRYVNNDKIRTSDGTMFALTKKKTAGSTGIAFKRKLSENEIKKLVDASFAPSTGSGNLQERLTREEFKAIVTSNKPGTEAWTEAI